MTPSMAALVGELEDGLAVGQGHLLAYVVNKWGTPNDVPDTIRRNMAVVSKARTALPALLAALEAGEREIEAWRLTASCEKSLTLAQWNRAEQAYRERDAALALAGRLRDGLLDVLDTTIAPFADSRAHVVAHEDCLRIARALLADPAVAALP